MKKALILVLAALVIPSAALAAKPAKPSHSPKTPPQATYKLKGWLSNYTAYDSVTPANGSITILVKSVKGPHGKSLKGATLTFPVDANTRISFAHHVTAITNGDRGSIKVRAAKNIPVADLALTLQLSPAAKIKDNGAPKPKH
jgi:hypothetical protein